MKASSAVTRGQPHPVLTLQDPAVILILLIAFYVIAAMFVGLSGNFPTNDDWAYAATTRQFVRTGVFAPSSWSAIPLISEVLFATPFCALSQCGSDDLRLATFVASVILFSMTFLLVNAATRRPAAALLAAVLMGFNPIAYALSFTFMSDMLFAALLAVGAFLFLCSIERGSIKLAVLASFVALAATLTRQLGLCLPLGYLAVCLMRTLQTRRWISQLVPSVLPLLLCIAGLVLLKHWLQSTGRLPALYDVKSNDLLNTLSSPVGALVRVGHNLAVMTLYMGLFTLPFMAITRRVALEQPRARWIARGIAGGATLLAAGVMLEMHRLMPLGGNILVPQGIGPMLLRDVGVLGLHNVLALPTVFWQIVTALALLGTFLLVERLATHIIETLMRLVTGRLDAVRLNVLFAVIALLAYAAPLMLIAFYDRYLVPMLPLTLYLLASNAGSLEFRRWRSGLAVALTGMIALFTISGTHDFMAWNRARWLALSELEQNGNSFSNIDGGLEYNGMHAFRPDYVPQPGKSWWWIDKDEYQVTFGPIPGLKILNSYNYQTLLPPAKRSILVLKREN